MGKGAGDRTANQMKTHPPERQSAIIIRGGLAFPPRLLGAAIRIALYTKNAAIPFPLVALSSLGDNVVESIFGSGILNGNMSQPSDDYRVEYVPSGEQTTGGAAKRSRA